MDEQSRRLPAYTGDEAEQALGFLEFLRDTVEWKTDGLDAEQLARRHPPSTMTLGGILKHLAFVEQRWFSHRFVGEPEREPWSSVDFDADPDWEWRTASDDDPAALRTLWREEVERSRRITAGADFDAEAAVTRPDGTLFNLRWVVLHLIEEYARHCGHVDLLRESIDGLTGE